MFALRPRWRQPIQRWSTRGRNSSASRTSTPTATSRVTRSSSRGRRIPRTSCRSWDAWSCSIASSVSPAADDAGRQALQQMLPQDFVDLKPEGDLPGSRPWRSRGQRRVYRQMDGCDDLCIAGDLRRDAARRNPDVERSEYVVTAGPVSPERAPVNCVGVVPRGSRPGEYDEATNLRAAEEQRDEVSTRSTRKCAFLLSNSSTRGARRSIPDSSTLTSPLGAIRATTEMTIGSTDYPAIFPTRTSFTPPPDRPRLPGQMDTTTTGFGSPPAIRPEGSRSPISSCCAAGTTSVFSGSTPRVRRRKASAAIRGW